MKIKFIIRKLKKGEFDKKHKEEEGTKISFSLA